MLEQVQYIIQKLIQDQHVIEAVVVNFPDSVKIRFFSSQPFIDVPSHWNITVTQLSTFYKGGYYEATVKVN